jgi:hypothetical protein
VDHQNKLGIAMPGTCGSEGYLKEKAKNRIEEIAPFDKFSTIFRLAILTKNRLKLWSN